MDDIEEEFWRTIYLLWLKSMLGDDKTPIRDVMEVAQAGADNALEAYRRVAGG